MDLFKTKITHSELEELHAMAVHFYMPEDEIEDWLKQLHNRHLYLMGLKLERLLKGERKKGGYKLQFDYSQTLAFFQLWHSIDTSAWPYGNVIIIRIIGEIDKQYSKTFV